MAQITISKKITKYRVQRPEAKEAPSGASKDPAKARTTSYGCTRSSNVRRC